MLFDPGSIPDFPRVMRKIIDLVNPRDISWIVTSHQDPMSAEAWLSSKT